MESSPDKEKSPPAVVIPVKASNIDKATLPKLKLILRQPAPESDEPDPAAKDFCFDTGNIRILIKFNGKILEGKASSDALCLASPVWRKFLFPPWEQAEELRHSVKQINFTEDDSEALLILLNICHLKFHRIPDSPPYHLLLQLAVLCDEYDCVNLVKPWLTQKLWLLDAEKESLLPGQHDWLFIAQTFGRKDILENLAKHVVTTIQVDGSAESTQILSSMPDGIKESILSCRGALIFSLLDIPYDLAESYVRCATRGSPSKIMNVCHKTTSQNQCDAAIYGSIILGLASIGLFPRPQPEDISMSIGELADLIQSIEDLYIDGIRNTTHSACRKVVDLYTEIEELLESFQVPSLDRYLRAV